MVEYVIAAPTPETDANNVQMLFDRCLRPCHNVVMIQIHTVKLLQLEIHIVQLIAIRSESCNKGRDELSICIPLQPLNINSPAFPCLHSSMSAEAHRCEM
jgi:hypothetical protein